MNAQSLLTEAKTLANRIVAIVDVLERDLSPAPAPGEDHGQH